MCFDTSFTCHLCRWNTRAKHLELGFWSFRKNHIADRWRGVAFEDSLENLHKDITCQVLRDSLSWIRYGSIVRQYDMESQTIIISTDKCTALIWHLTSSSRQDMLHDDAIVLSESSCKEVQHRFDHFAASSCFHDVDTNTDLSTVQLKKRFKNVKLFVSPVPFFWIDWLMSVRQVAQVSIGMTPSETQDSW